jgi:hypothetical protein
MAKKIATTATTALAKEANNMVKMPISFEQFSKDPVKGLLFIVLIAIGYLYVDGKMNYQSQIEKHENKIVVLENKIDLLSTALKRSDSALAVTVTKLEILTQMSK